MAAFRLLLSFFLATICCCSLVDAAAVNNLFLGHRLENTDNVGIASEIGAPIENAEEIFRATRSIESDKKTVRICVNNTPCGWAVYIPFTRRVDYFMKNTCVCPSHLKCTKTDDDLSVSAYVYKCKNDPGATDIEQPDEA